LPHYLHGAAAIAIIGTKLYYILEHPLRTREKRKKKKKEKKEKKERCCSYEQIYRTMGLISADRSNKATLPLTIPRSIKVVCNGFISSNI